VSEAATNPATGTDQNTQAAPAGVDPVAAPTTESNVAPPEGFPTDLWKDGAPDVAAIAELATLKAEREKRQAEVPADGAYSLSLPEDLTTYKDKPVEIDMESPAVKVLMEAAKRHNLTQAEVNELAAMSVKAEIEHAEKLAESEVATRTEDLKKLGEKPQERLENLVKTVRAQIPDEAQATALLKSISTADAALAVEALLGRLIGTSTEPASGEGVQNVVRTADKFYPSPKSKAA
jgi:hypothetical protein